MSTNWGFACVSHDPPLVSEHWLNHGDKELTAAFLKVRRGEWPGQGTGMPAVVVGPGGRQGTMAPIDWLEQHPRCRVVLHNEYGDTREILAPDGKPPCHCAEPEPVFMRWDAGRLIPVDAWVRCLACRCLIAP